ncbi:MAG: FG-GAP repeat protein [Planctomycetota bacterium]|jgi:hypothetical protein
MILNLPLRFSLVILLAAVGASTPAQVLQETKILPADAAAGDEFGAATCLDGGVLVVGAVSADDFGVDSGAVYLFDASTGL